MKYLIIKLGALGDVIMSLPMVDRIRELDNNAEIDWLIFSCNKIVLPSDKVDNVYEIDSIDLSTVSIYKKIKLVLDAWKKIGFHQYDSIFLAHNDFRYKLLTLFTRRKNIYQMNVRGRNFIQGRYFPDEYIRMIEQHDENCEQLAKIVTYPHNVSTDITALYTASPLTELFKRLGVSPGQAEVDACKVEHDLSAETYQKIVEFVERQRT